MRKLFTLIIFAILCSSILFSCVSSGSSTKPGAPEEQTKTVTTSPKPEKMEEVKPIVRKEEKRELTNKQVEDAVTASFAASFLSSMMVAFGKELPGVVYDKKKNLVTYTNFMFKEIDEKNEIQTKYGYSSLSGTFTGDEKANKSIINVTLFGGPVKTLKYEILGSQLQNNDPTKKIKINAIANGQMYEIEWDPEMN